MAELESNPSAINIFQNLPRSIRGDDIGAQYRGPYKDQITNSEGSVNISIMRACHDLWFAIHHEPGRVNGILAQFAAMARERALGDKEANSDFVYGDFNSSSYKVARCGAEFVGHAAAEALRGFELSDALMWALSAAWRKEAGFYAVQRTGARSWICDRKGGTSYIDPSGNLYMPFMMDGNGFGPLLLGALGLDVPAGWHVNLAEAVDAATGGDVGFWDHSAEEISVMETVRKIKKKLSEPQKVAVAKAVGWIDAGPRRHVPSRVIRTEGSVAWVNMVSSAPGSTSYRYGRAWFNGSIPPGPWDDWPWQWRRQNLHLAADPPKRKAGTSGRAEVIERGGELIARCQRTMGKDGSPPLSWWDIRDGQFKEGWFELPLGLASSVVLDIEIGKNTVKVNEGGGGEVPIDPPVDPPGGGGGGSSRRKLLAAIRLAKRADNGAANDPDAGKMKKARTRLSKAIQLVGG